MPGPVALVGAGEFLPAMADFDAGLLASTGRSRPRVAILPTASFPDGEDVFQRWAAMGVAHFGELGAEVEPVLVRDRAGADDPAAAQAIGEADLVYLSGGKPGYLAGRAGRDRGRQALGAAHERGAVLAGCSAGAMVLAGHLFDFRAPGSCPWPLRWRAGLGFVPKAPRSCRTTTRGRSRVTALDRAPGAARVGGPRASTRTRPWSAATGRGRSTAGPGSRSGGVATATATARGDMFRF